MNNKSIVPLVLKAVALAISVAVIVLGFLGVATAETSFTLLALGLFCIALWAFMKDR